MDTTKPNFFKYCPKCGSANHKFINHHRFECFDCNFVYYHNVAAAVMVIIKRENKFLFTVRNIEPEKGKLDFPGGFIDPSENAQEAAVRELKEELNLDLCSEDLNLLHTESNDYIFRDIQYRTLDVVFELNLKNNVKIDIEKAEIKNIKWLAADEVNYDELGFKSMKKVVSKFILTQVFQEN